MKLDDLVKAGWLTFAGWQMLFGPKANREEYDAEMKRRIDEYVRKRNG